MIPSLLDFFSIGIGPSSSHAVGPMRAARRFADWLAKQPQTNDVSRLTVSLYGSLALTGRGHGTDLAIVAGLCGESPEGVDPASMTPRYQAADKSGRITLLGGSDVAFKPSADLLFRCGDNLPGHANGMRFEAYDGDQLIASQDYYSVGGGFVVTADELTSPPASDTDERPWPFNTAAELLAFCDHSGQPVSQLALENERRFRSDDETRVELLKRWQVMQDCVTAGSQHAGELPGGLKVRRRAPVLYQRLTTGKSSPAGEMLAALDWVNLFALAVNEENAAGGRVVTAPTNGAAGIVPAVLHYYRRFCPGASDDGVVRYLLTAGAIAWLYKNNASLSGAEVGCQGEVGVACSMAAAGLTEVLGGTPHQVEQAAEIGMEHHLGLTCDPVGGLVQVPCIERNAVASVTAINASRLALASDGQHRVSLDRVIATMRNTGADMLSKYKETAQGGLSVDGVTIDVPVSLPEC